MSRSSITEVPGSLQLGLRAERLLMARTARSRARTRFSFDVDLDSWLRFGELAEENSLSRADLLTRLVEEALAERRFS